jgi:hypothetical protein
MEETGTIILVLAIVVIVFLVLREFWTWYWKVNLLLKGQEQTNRLLTQLVNLQATGKTQGEIQGEVIVENTSTGKLSGISQEEWDKLNSSNPKQKKYRRIE